METKFKNNTPVFWSITIAQNGNTTIKIHDYRLRQFLALYGFCLIQTDKDRTQGKTLVHNDYSVL